MIKRAWRKLIMGGMAALCPLAAAGDAALANWTYAQRGEAPVLERRFGSGTLSARVSPWFRTDAGSLRTWLNKRKSRASNGAPVISDNHYVANSKLRGSYYVLRKLRARRGRQQMSLLTVCPGRKGTARTVDVVGPKSLFTDKHSIDAGVRLTMHFCQKIGNAGSSKGSVPTTEANVVRNSETRRAQAPGGPLPTAAIARPKPPPGLTGLQGIIYYGIQPGGLFGTTSMTIALFSDHSYTEDLATVFNQGIAVSKRKKPKKWGRWRKCGGKLELKAYKDNEFDPVRGEWRARPGGGNQKLSGCFGRLVSDSGLGTGSVMVGRARTWCFWPNGRFTHKATGFGISSGGVGGAVAAARPGLRGRYRIDGYAMRLVYDDGSDVQAGFAFLNADHSHIAINGRRFMGRKK